MLRKAITLTLTLLMLTYPLQGGTHTKPPAHTPSVERVKGIVKQLGTGSAAKVKVRLLDGRKLEGYISEADDTAFVIVRPETGESTSVTYPQVKKINSNTKGVLIGLAVAAVVIVIVLVSLSKDE